MKQVGPRFCLNPIKIFGGSFGGPTLYENSFYVSPNQVSKKDYLVLMVNASDMCANFVSYIYLLFFGFFIFCY